MTTLNAIGFTTAGSTLVAIFAFIVFSFAVRSADPKVSPRCTARPPETVFNAKAKPKRKYKSFCAFLCSCMPCYNADNGTNSDAKAKKNDGDDDIVVVVVKKSNDGDDDENILNKEIDSNVHNLNNNNKDDDESKKQEYVQYRGGPMFGWIPWVMSLSYEQMLKGVPGTGTRKNGLAGSMLKVNLDGIVLLRFHAICLRMALVATALAAVVVLPINLTANCHTDENGYFSCYSSPHDTNLTNYERTTIENIPILDISNELLNEFNWYNSIFGASFKIFGTNYGSFLGRFYAIVGVSWVLTFYCLHILRKEWVDILALRRVFYLEGRHWENRIEELNDTVLKDDMDSSDDDETSNSKPGALRKRRLVNKKKKGLKKKKKKDAISNRPQNIPHPEQRDTVPNIELYSVLVGEIPAVPSEIAHERTGVGNDANSNVNVLKFSIDWQLQVTTTFFDQCVPNQPGFSSSVAAVTMLPDAPKLALAWKTWYRHCKLLRRLRFIRELIANKRHYNIDECIPNYPDDTSEVGNQTSADENDKTDEADEKAPFSNFQDHLDDDDYPGAGLSEREKAEYAAIQHRINYYADVFGAEFNDVAFREYGDDGEYIGKDPGKDNLMSQILSYGPEQTSVYSKEFARGAAACCPNGCREQKMREQLTLPDLEELEKKLEEEVDLSFALLKKVQQSNYVRDESAHPPFIDKQDDKSNDFNDVEMQLYSRTPTKFSVDPSVMNGKSYETVFRNDQNQENLFDEGHSELVPQQIQAVGSNASSAQLPPLPPNRESPSPSFQNYPTQQLSVSAQGKVYFKEVTTAGSNTSENGEDPYMASWSSNTPKKMKQDDFNALNDPGVPQYFSRRRLDTGGFSQMTLPLVEENKVSDWEKVQQAVQDNNEADGKKDAVIKSGAWKIPSIGSIFCRILKKIRSPMKKTFNAVDEIKSISTFAVVTFTSRQAAVAARHCLADGRGVGRWVPVEDIPVPPLADAAVCDICDCRGCCRPVTLTIHPKQQMIRRYITTALLACIFIFYTLPLTFAAALVAPEKLNNLFPGIKDAAENSLILSNLLSGIMPAAFYSLFFALCPIMFKALSNFGSNAVSVNQAEYIALQYYWWFMLFTAFSGTSLTTMALNFFDQKLETDVTIQDLLLSIAAALPRQVSATWLNWIIFRTFCTLPLMYMLNIHTYFFQCIGWKCCIRCVMGGGAGGPVPYRIYIDSGVVFLCVMGLTPISPLLAPAALLYFLFCAPLWRRNCLYMYRPYFDTGGIRWPFLCDMLISAMYFAQILLTTTMALKKALGPAILSGLLLFPVYFHRKSTRKKYLRSYMDAALLQTSQLDGWDNTLPTSKEMREEYRKFLVDAHKAAYVPICLAGEEASGMTNEPAVVTPHPNDILEPVPLQHPPGEFDHAEQQSVHSNITPLHPYNSMSRNRFQPGVSWRRVQNLHSFNDEGSNSTPSNIR